MTPATVELLNKPLQRDAGVETHRVDIADELDVRAEDVGDELAE